MSNYIEAEYNKLSVFLQENGLSHLYFLKIERSSIEIYDSNNKFIYASNDIEDLKENISFLKILEEKNEKNKSTN